MSKQLIDEIRLYFQRYRLEWIDIHEMQYLIEHLINKGWKLIPPKGKTDNE